MNTPGRSSEVDGELRGSLDARTYSFEGSAMWPLCYPFSQYEVSRGLGMALEDVRRASEASLLKGSTNSCIGRISSNVYSSYLDIIGFVAGQELGKLSKADEVGISNILHNLEIFEMDQVEAYRRIVQTRDPDKLAKLIVRYQAMAWRLSWRMGKTQEKLNLVVGVAENWIRYYSSFEKIRKLRE
jgi:hypothetical protein